MRVGAWVLFLIFILFCKMGQAQNITSSMKGWWKYDEASSGTCTGTTPDSSGNGLTGTCHSSPTYISGKIGPGAMVFSGSNYMSTAQLNLGATSLTFAVWVKTTSTSNNMYVLNGYLDSTAQVQICVNVGSIGKATMFSTSTNTRIASTTSVNDGNWHHVVYLYNVANTTMYIYVDGSQQASGNAGSLTWNTWNLVIGGDWPSDSGGGYIGDLDDARLYNRVLSAADIKTLYQYTGTQLGFFRLMRRR